ncbi:TIGR04206 family protein [Salinirubellus salinus]|uniref:TIGR04206 family protein n=1 Tax=Salinirubellus salinus TaxID=1364945 RepID=A0A9E7R6V4_9EURY|nr:TIGR04206 family protein [Salinirubellus salinus]UWM56398.1 TIGR04206 family protein [Salinirubellus salinus]
MVWVRSEYAGEFAVLSAWLSALLPWSVSFAQAGPVTLVVLRFPLFLFQFTLNLSLEGEQPFQTVLRAVARESGAVQRAYTVWLVGAGVFVLALVLSVGYYALDERLEARLAIDPVRLMAVLLLATGLVLGLASVLVVSSYVGLTVPIGVFFLLALGYLLLVVERAPDDPEETDAAATPE